jgi:hypothetical protein
MVMGVRRGEDFPCFETTLPIMTNDLMPIMGWQNNNDRVFDYRLTEQQTCDIERACSTRLPRDLELFLTSFA